MKIISGEELDHLIFSVEISIYERSKKRVVRAHYFKNFTTSDVLAFYGKRPTNEQLNALLDFLKLLKCGEDDYS